MNCRSLGNQLLCKVCIVGARLMNTDLPVLISGESGTGKSLIAKVLHSFSDRRNLPLVAVSPSDLIDLDGPAKVLAKVKGAL
ncbi:MAG: hypothetical protein CM15mP85_11540 [Rhodobacterales bacterium]|nr:MAG: hypothetical protein CM15mP85_11540 [Rhodobacterales bacterium]